MNRGHRRRRRSHSDSTVPAQIQTLEDRIMLSGTGSDPTLDLEGLTIDQTSFSTTQILVKWTTPAGLENNLSATAMASSILAGSTSEAVSPLLTSLQKVTLPEGIDVETALQIFQNNPLVEYAQLDHRVSITVTPGDPQYTSLWGLENEGQTGGFVDADIDASAAWDVNTGTGQTIVAVTDTGIDYNHPDLIDNMWINPGEIAGDGIDNDGNGYIDDIFGYDFINNDNAPLDDQGHGTHVAGTIGAVGDNNIGITGVSWNVQLMALKFIGADGSGTESDAIEAILYAIDNGAHIINASWGDYVFAQALSDAVAATRDAGIIFVAGAGNGDQFGFAVNTDANPFYPASDSLDNIVSVAATDHTDNMASFSNYGATTVDLAAPGVDILSTAPGGGYQYLSGTSMATPHVAGVLALVHDLHPEWTYDQIIQQVLSTVDPLPQLAGLMVTGGRLNAAAALGNAVPPPPPPPPVALPLVENFSDGEAQAFLPKSGAWSVNFGRYDVYPGTSNDDLARIATFNLETPLPSDLEIHATVNVNEGFQEIFGIIVTDYLTNGFVVFDYVDFEDFKFAGADMDANQWVIGHRDSNGWHIDASVSDIVDASINYGLKVTISEGNTVTLSAGGFEKVSHSYTNEDILDGDLGIGSRNAVAHFDDILVQAIPAVTPGALPITDDFEDGVADHLSSISGQAYVTNGVYQLSAPANANAVSIYTLSSPLPADLEVFATVNVDPNNSNRYTNGLIIFDYQSPTDFKFAGLYNGTDEWVIGHNDGTGWIKDASTSAPINALTDYDLRLLIESDGTVTLYANGSPVVSTVYSGSPLTNGDVGFGTWNAVARFDDVTVQEFVPPSPPPSVPFPLSEDFNDGTADGFAIQVGTDEVSGGRYQLSAEANGNGLTTINFSDPLPNNVELLATINVDPSGPGRYTNGLIVFDYQSPTDFKFAGAYNGTDEWVIGHNDGTGWIKDASTSAPISALTDYGLRLVIENGVVTLHVDGAAAVSTSYAGSLTDGDLGFGTWNAVARYDNVIVQELVPPPPPPAVSFPLNEDFEDGVANGFVIQVGTDEVSGGRYQLSAEANGNGLSTINFSDPLPDNVELLATINVDPSGPGRYTNGLIVFDYQSPTDFKFAGAYNGTDEWVIGHNDGTGWIKDASTSAPISALTDYNLRLTIESNGTVTLHVDGAAVVSTSYSGSLTDGDLGFGTWNGVVRYDNVIVQDFVPPPPPPSITLPLSEDFEDGVADGFEVQAGSALVSGGIYHLSADPSGDAVSTINFSDPLTDNVELLARVNVDPSGSGRYTNGVIVFDYQSATNFKFAGLYNGSNQWVIGRRTSAGWITDAATSAPISELTDYDLRLVIESNGAVTLYADGAAVVSRSYSGSLTDGDLGFGNWNAVSRYDNVIVQEYVPQTGISFPLAENFDDGVADGFEVQAGSALVSGGIYHLSADPSGDAVSTIDFSDPLPANVEVLATVNVDPSSSTRYTNGLIIFDYQGPTDFKFSGLYNGSDQWVIGRRTAAGWITDAATSAPISALTDYNLRLVIESDGTVTLYEDGASVVSTSYAGTLTDGDLGFGNWNAVSRYDNVTVQEFTTSTTQIQSFADQTSSDSDADQPVAVGNSNANQNWFALPQRSSEDKEKKSLFDLFPGSGE